jgi:hypothetical protein
MATQAALAERFGPELDAALQSGGADEDAHLAAAEEAARAFLEAEPFLKG